MFRLFIVFYATLQLTSFQLVLSDILCKDSRIDSITYSNDLKMYFFTSAGHYWWLKEAEFPPKDKFAKPLPAPFEMGHSAVYLDTASSCTNSQSEGEKVVWVEEYVNGEHKIMTFDAKTGNWRPDAIIYNKNRCISRARIDWSSGKRVDAMFVRNNLDVYVIQDKVYAMVDCNFLCSNPESGFGSDKPTAQTTDFRTINPILAMFVMRNKILYMLHEKTYYELTIEPSSKNGKLDITKDMTEKAIIKDLMKIENPSVCLETTTKAIEPVVSGETQAVTAHNSEGVDPGQANDISQPVLETTKKPTKESGGSSMAVIGIVLVIIVVVVIVSIGAIAYFAMKPKTDKTTGSDVEAKDKAAKENKTSADDSKTKGVAADKPDKTGAAAGQNKPSGGKPSAIKPKV